MREPHTRRQRVAFSVCHAGQRPALAFAGPAPSAERATAAGVSDVAPAPGWEAPQGRGVSVSSSNRSGNMGGDSAARRQAARHCCMAGPGSHHMRGGCTRRGGGRSGRDISWRRVRSHTCRLIKPHQRQTLGAPPRALAQVTTWPSLVHSVSLPPLASPAPRTGDAARGPCGLPGRGWAPRRWKAGRGNERTERQSQACPASAAAR